MLNILLLLKNFIYKLTAENFAARLKQANLVNKTDFQNKLTSFSRKITSNKTLNKLNKTKQDSLKTKIRGSM